MLSCEGVCGAAQPFLAALLHDLLPQRPIVVVTEGLKTQESFQQDVATWLQVGGCKSQAESPSQNDTCGPRFYPAWEILPHEEKLPHRVCANCGYYAGREVIEIEP